MPPKRSQNRQKNTEQKGRLLLAIQSIQNSQTTFLRDVVRQFDISEVTLRRRMKGVINRAETRVNNYKLTQIEEQLLVK